MTRARGRETARSEVLLGGQRSDLVKWIGRAKFRILPFRAALLWPPPVAPSPSALPVSRPRRRCCCGVTNAASPPGDPTLPILPPLALPSPQPDRPSSLAAGETAAGLDVGTPSDRASDIVCSSRYIDPATGSWKDSGTPAIDELWRPFFLAEPPVRDGCPPSASRSRRRRSLAMVSLTSCSSAGVRAGRERRELCA